MLDIGAMPLIYILRMLCAGGCLSLCGCFQSHELSSGEFADGGSCCSDDGGYLDLDGGDSSTNDRDFGQECGHTAGLENCGAGCRRCTFGTACTELDVCLGRLDSTGMNDRCGFRLSSVGGAVTATGRLCALVTDAVLGRFDGYGVDETFCALRPDIDCVHSDGTVWDGAPLTGTCPTGSMFCGPGCGSPICTPGVTDTNPLFACVGVSNGRSVGICGSPYRCDAGELSGLSQCSRDYSEPCSCLTTPTLPGTSERAGFAVTQRNCAAYEAAFPEVSCHDQDWNVL